MAGGPGRKSADPLKESLEELNRVADDLIDGLRLEGDPGTEGESVSDALSGLERQIDEQVTGQDLQTPDESPEQADIVNHVDTLLSIGEQRDNEAVAEELPVAESPPPESIEPLVESAPVVEAPEAAEAIAESEPLDALQHTELAVAPDPRAGSSPQPGILRWILAAIGVAILLGGGLWLFRTTRTRPLPAPAARPAPMPTAAPVEALPIETLELQSAETSEPIESPLAGGGAEATAIEDAAEQVVAPVSPPAKRAAMPAKTPAKTPAPKPKKAAPAVPESPVETKPVAPTPKPETPEVERKTVPEQPVQEPVTEPAAAMPPPNVVAPPAAARIAPKETVEPAPADLSFQPAEVVERIEPAYPPRARSRGESGGVTLEVLVDEEGKVVRVMVKESTAGRELEAASIDAVLRWKYRPAQENGHAIRSWVVETFSFEP